MMARWLALALVAAVISAAMPPTRAAECTEQVVSLCERTRCVHNDAEACERLYSDWRQRNRLCLDCGFAMCRFGADPERFDVPVQCGSLQQFAAPYAEARTEHRKRMRATGGSGGIEQELNMPGLRFEMMQAFVDWVQQTFPAEE